MQRSLARKLSHTPDLMTLYQILHSQYWNCHWYWEALFCTYSLLKRIDISHILIWLSQPNDPESEFIVYHFRVVLFRSVSSPFMFGVALYKLQTAQMLQKISSRIFVLTTLSQVSQMQMPPQTTTYYKSHMAMTRFNLCSWEFNHNAINTIT